MFQNRTALISCASGHIIEVEIPTSRPLYTKESYLLKLESRVINTASVTSKSDRNQHELDTERKEKERTDEEEILETNREGNVHVEVDRELYSTGSRVDDDETPRVFVPVIPNPVLFAIYTPSENSLWVSIDGCDAGYLYEYDFNVSEPINEIAIPDKHNIPLTSIAIM